MKEKVVMGSFEIPEALAKELDELLIKQNIRERILALVIDQPDRYNDLEEMLIPIVSRIEAIKVKITEEYVPAEYRSEKYTWNYDGYEISGCNVKILADKER